MRLVAARQESLSRTEIRVMLGSNGPSLRKIVSEPYLRREIQIFETIIGGIENGVDEEIPIAEVPADESA